MSFTVREITGDMGMNDFLSIPPEIYRNDPNWVAPQLSEIKRTLNPSLNPYFVNASLRLYVGYSDGKPVCRSIMVINHLHWIKWKKKSAFFGFFESIDDSNAVKYLFDRIEADSREAGAEYLEGPFNPNHYSELGILIDNFNSVPGFFETYNPPYYPQLLQKTGFSELKIFHTRHNNKISATLSENFRITNPANNDNDYTIRKFNIFRLKRDLGIMREINNEAFEDNWYFLPLSQEEYKFSAKFLFFVTLPGLIQIVEYKGKPAGTIQCVLNFNRLIKPYNGKMNWWNLPGLLLRRRNLKELVVFTIGIKKAFHHTPVLGMIVKSALKIFQDYSTLTTTWISDENKGVIHFTEFLEMKPYKHFAIYSKHLK